MQDSCGWLAASLNSFTGTLSLSAVLTSCPSTCQGGPASGVSPTVVDLSGGYGTPTLTITPGYGTATYTITVRGTCSSGDCSNPAQSHSIRITVTVTNNLRRHSSISSASLGSLIPFLAFTRMARAAGTQEWEWRGGHHSTIHGFRGLIRHDPQSAM